MLGRRLVVLSLLLAGCRDAPAQTPHSAPKDETARESAPAVDRLADLEDRAFPLLIWSAYRVDQEYFDKERFDPRQQVISAARFLGLHTPEFFAELEGDGRRLRIKVRSRSATFELDDVVSMDSAADRLEEILVFAQEVLDLDTEPLHELEYAAINGMFAPLDPHTVLLSPEEHNDLGVRTRGHFGGIGAQIRAEDRRILIVRVLPGMPAEAAGMKAGDVVLTIDGAATVNMPADEAQSLLRGPVGEVVVVVVRRGEQTLSLEITRDTIHVDSVDKAMLPGGIAYLSISTFQENTGERVEAALRELSEARAVVLDLRGNSGGLLTQATAVVDAFVPRGDLVIVRSAQGREVEDATDAVALEDAKPVVVLIDEDSASAAEIVSGGLKALGRAVVLGRSSFGKGTVQMVKPASPYGRELALKLTVAEYLVAGDSSIQSLGVLPDVELLPVEMSLIPGIARYFDEERFERQRERSRTAHLPSSKHDPQLPADRGGGSSLRYLWTGEVPTGLSEATDDVTVRDRLQDPEIRIAREIALGLPQTTDREARAATLAEVVERLSVEEDERIVEALAESKVNWSGDEAASPADASAAPKLEVGLTLATEGPLPAGDPFVVRLTVKNLGDAPLRRVHGITDCVHDELDGIEVLVGELGPGQEVFRELELHVMPWHSDFTDVLGVDLHVGEPDDEPDARAQMRFDVTGAARPELSYDWWIVDDPALVAKAPARPEVELLPGETPFEVQGNGDGMLQPGEHVLLAFVARNDGPGTSPDVRAILRNHSSTQGLLEEGAVALGPLGPGDEASASFGITVNDQADPGLPFEVELAVGDAQIRARAQDELRLRVLPAAESLVPKDEWVRVEGEPLRVYGGGHASAPVVVELPVGTELATVGTLGAWRVVELSGRGRRMFVPGDLGVVSDRKGRPQPSEQLAMLEHTPLVVPPSLELEAVPRVVSDDHVTIRGTAIHPRRLRDVAVLVRPPGASQIDRKIHYAANPNPQGAAAQSLSFTADVPLEPGGNRIIILARDGQKVELHHDVWVFREPAVER
ncbi:MAG: MXAN_5808 family serine peptidase [Nannocystaceae bacterium]